MLTVSHEAADGAGCELQPLTPESMLLTTLLSFLLQDKQQWEGAVGRHAAGRGGEDCCSRRAQLVSGFYL